MRAGVNVFSTMRTSNVGKATSEGKRVITKRKNNTGKTISEEQALITMRTINMVEAISEEKVVNENEQHG